MKAFRIAITYTDGMKTVPNSNHDAVVGALCGRIQARLARNIPVLFLVSGENTAEIAFRVCSAIAALSHGETGKLKLLFTVGLLDERFGAPGHVDSNWRLLIEKGLDPAHLSAMPILTEVDGEASLEKTVDRYNGFLTAAVKRQREGNLAIITLAEMGADGHIAGILPESPASRIDCDADLMVTGYRSALFARITVTPAFFRFIDYAAVWLTGSDKWPAFDRLSSDLSVHEQPAQLFKLVKETEIFADIDIRERAESHPKSAQTQRQSYA